VIDSVLASATLNHVPPMSAGKRIDNSATMGKSSVISKL
jgi:hypothetical protein